MDAPGFTGVLGHWAWDLPWLAALIGSAALFLHPYLKTRGRRTAHPRWRLASFLTGVTLVALVALSPIEYWGNHFLWVNFLGFLLLTMIAAPLIVLGAPLTLAFRVAGSGGRRRLRRLARHPMVSGLTFPVLTWLTFAILTYVWQFTALTDAAAQNVFVRDLQLASLLVVALFFWSPALCADPVGRRMPYPVRALYVFVEMTHKGLFGGMFLSAQTPFHNGFARSLPSWSGLSPLDDQRLGILILWIGGNAIFLVALGAIILGWLAYERRNAHRIDWRLALARREREVKRRALDEVFRRGV